MQIQQQDFRERFKNFDDGALITVPEIAALLVVTPGSIYQRVYAGTICELAMRGNRLLRWRAGTYREWIKGVKAASEPVESLSQKGHYSLGRPRKVVQHENGGGSC